MSCGKCAGEPNVKLAEGMRKSGGSTKKDLVRAAEIAENSGAAAFDVFTPQGKEHTHGQELQTGSDAEEI